MSCSKRELLERMDGVELGEWFIKWQVDPFGERRDDYRAASICSTMANIHRPRNTKAFSLSDFMLKFLRERIDPRALMMKLVAGFRAKKR